MKNRNGLEVPNALTGIGDFFLKIPENFPDFKKNPKFRYGPKLKKSLNSTSEWIKIP